MAVTGMANLAVKVADLDAACDFYERAGAEVRDRMIWGNGERADVFLGPVQITLFTKAIYEDSVDAPRRGISASCAIHRRSRQGARRSPGRLGTRGGRGRIRARGASRLWTLQVVYGSSSWSSSSSTGIQVLLIRMNQCAAGWGWT